VTRGQVVIAYAYNESGNSLLGSSIAVETIALLCRGDAR
jgi:hypothetical protein